MAYDVISAISTAPGTGGVAIIKMSGVGALDIAAQMFVASSKTPVKSFRPNVMYAGNILCEGFTDYGMCVYFKAPKSFTGEDVVEFHCHGGVHIARGVLKATVAHGARLAGGGEFTKRAFVNGKLSLSSAEGMIEMINAESLAQLRAGGLLYRERLTQIVVPIQEELKDVLAGIAADVDYPEEGIEETKLTSVGGQLKGIIARLNALIKAYPVGKLIKNGVLVAICGAPNVGKSSLLNALLGYDKAIVSPIAGTTRDAVEGSMEIDGVRYNFVDTAGIRENAGEIEAVGIERARSALKSADLVVCVSENADYSAAEGVEEQRLIRVFSKTDKVKPFGKYDVSISSVTGDGLEDLKGELSRRATGGSSLNEEFLIEERHFTALKEAKEKLEEAVKNIGDFPLDLISIDVTAAWQKLGEITGEAATEEIISTVFSKFCVGK